MKKMTKNEMKKSIECLSKFLILSDKKIGYWLSAALEDPNVCQEFKADITEWFDKMAESTPYMPTEILKEWLIADGINTDSLVKLTKDMIKNIENTQNKSEE